MKDKILRIFNKEKFLMWVVYWIALGVGFIALTFVVTSVWIGFDVRDNCFSAQSKYEGDCVDALITLLDDEENSFRERNTAIWSLGQLGNERALDILNFYYTGEIPDREPLDESLSQYELKKAIKLIESGFNITHIVWSPEDL